MRLVAAAVVAAVAAGGCGVVSGDEASVAPSEEPAMPADTEVPTVELSFDDMGPLPSDLQAALDGAYAGQRVEIAGGWFLIDQVQDALDQFATRTGMDIRYKPIRNMESEIFTMAQLGQLPSLVHTLQISTMRELYDRGYLLAMPGDVADMVDTEFAPSRDAYLAPGEELYTVPFKIDAKSLVWYSPTAFERAGFTVPTTTEELDALVDRMLGESEVAPWCVGIAADGATGYVVTDWLENYLLRMSPPEVYDDWTAHRIPFDAAPVAEALDAVGHQWYGDERSVFGGSQGVLGLSISVAGDGLFGDPPGCWMHSQSLWIQLVWEDAGYDSSTVDYFILPGADRSIRPMLLSGSFLGLTRDDPAARAVLEFMVSVPGLGLMVRDGDFLAPNKNVPIEWYNPRDRRLVDYIASSNLLRFDASDSMPNEIGTNVEWTEMVEWAESEGTITAEVLSDIEGKWPSP